MDAMSPYIPALLAMLGALLGSAIVVVGNLVTKRQERRTQLHKIISEKRLEAYEEIITTVRWAAVGTGEYIDGIFIKAPVILDSTESFDTWFGEFVVRDRRTAHLVDSRLAAKLLLFQNYLHNFDIIALDPRRDPINRTIEPEILRQIGIIVYGDFLELANSIVEQASHFYSSDIYSARFRPATIDRQWSTDGDDLRKYRLFTHRTEIEKIH